MSLSPNGVKCPQKRRQDKTIEDIYFLVFSTAPRGLGLLQQCLLQNRLVALYGFCEGVMLHTVSDCIISQSVYCIVVQVPCEIFFLVISIGRL